MACNRLPIDLCVYSARAEQNKVEHLSQLISPYTQWKTSKVASIERKSDISQGTIDDLASILVNYLTRSVKKVRVLR